MCRQDDASEVGIYVDTQPSEHLVGGSRGRDGGLLDSGQMRPVVFLRAAWFMENAAWDIASAREGNIQSYLQPLDRPFPMIATDDVGRTAAALLREHWEGRRVVELEGAQRVSPNTLADAFAKVLAQPVRAQAVPRDRWESIFRAQGMKNPTPRMQMLDGFNAGWIDFPNRGANARKGSIGIDQAIAALIQKSQRF